MTSPVLQDQAKAYEKPRPEIRPGFTVRIHERIQEGNKERIQVFEGLVIAVHKGATSADTTVTVRRIASGVGVEKVFSLNSPKIEKVEVKKVAKVRRSKLFFLRGRRGKAARLSERFTTAEEFAVATPVVEEEEKVEEVVEETAEETKDSEETKETEEKDPKEEVKKKEPKKEESEDAGESDDSKEEEKVEKKEE